MELFQEYNLEIHVSNFTEWPPPQFSIETIADAETTPTPFKVVELLGYR